MFAAVGEALIHATNCQQPLLAECLAQGLEVWGALGGVPALWTAAAEPNYPWVKDPRANYFVIDPRDPAFPGVIER